MSSTSSLEEKYEKACKRIEEYTKERDEIKKELVNLQKERDRSRAIPIRYEEFAKLAGHSDDFWTELEVNDVYHNQGRCQIEDCWYKGNSDRLDGLELYSCNGMNDELGDDWVICDVCFENDCASEIIEQHEEEDDTMIYVMPNDLESARKKYATYEEEQLKEKEEAIAKEKKEKEDRVVLWNTTLQKYNGDIEKTTEKTGLLPCGDCKEVIDLFKSHGCHEFSRCEDYTRCWSCDVHHRIYDHKETLRIVNQTDDGNDE